MKKSLLLILVVSLLVSLMCVSCDEEILEKVGNTLTQFAGMDKEFSAEEIEAQTKVVADEANSFSSATNVNDIKSFLNSIVDNSACDLNAATTLSKTDLEELAKATNPVKDPEAIQEIAEDLGFDIPTEFSLSDPEVVEEVLSSATDMVKEVLGEEVADKITSIIDVIMGDPLSTDTDVVTLGDVAKVGAQSMMADALVGIVGAVAPMASGGASDPTAILSDPAIVEAIGNFDNAAKAYSQFEDSSNDYTLMGMLSGIIGNLG